MNEQEKHAASQEERKEKIRARYKVVNRSELEFIPAKQKEKLFEDVEYVELLFNSVEKCIAVRPCERSGVNAIKWGTIRDGRWAVLPKSCKGFSEPLYELMGWNLDCRYKILGHKITFEDETINNSGVG